MAKKDSSKKPDLTPEDADVEERVRQMMDPSVKDPEPSGTDSYSPATAPEITDLPVPKEPLKIKILHDNEDPEVDSEPLTAPELASEPDVEPIAKPATESKPEAKITEKTEPETDPAKQQAIPEEGAEPDPEPSEDPETSKAVEDIVRNESDELLKAEDDKLMAAFEPKQNKTFGQKLKSAIVDLWKNPKKRKILMAVFVVVVLAVGIVPGSRYFVLNAAGVRSSASVHVLDESTFQPLKNVEVTIHGVSARTNENGDAKVDRIKLGSTRLKIERRAFAPVERNITIGWGSNPLGEEKLRPTGTQYAFSVSDYLSGKSVVKAEATSGDASAFSDENGKILLTIEDPTDELDISIVSEGRRTERLKLNGDTKDETPVKMVPARKHAYISRREGRYDVYATYADGKEETLVLKGTGNERDDMVLVPHPSEDLAALVSTRAGKRNDDGYLLSDLTIIDLRTKGTETAETSERIQLSGWFGERLVYVRVVAGASASHPKRNRLMAYHYKDDTNNELAASNYFNDVMAVDGRVYYAPSGVYQSGASASLFSVKADGTDRRTILDKEVWNLFRTSYDHIAISVPGSWYDYRIGQQSTTKLDGEPASLKSLVFTNSPNGEKSLWVDTRDGKGVLIAYDTKTGEDRPLRTQSGLKNPVRWLNDSTIVYRVKTDAETADYALSLDGGEPKKVADVTNTDGIDKWYYY